MLYNKEQLEKLTHRWTTKRGKALIKIIRKSKCYLSPVLFRQKVQNFPGINDKELNGEIDLRGAPLAGFDFKVSVKEEDNGFVEDIAILSGIHFEGASLRHCNFEEGKIHDCFFENADLSHSEFKNSTINSTSFAESDCTGANFHGAKLINCGFIDADINDMVVDSVIVDQKTTFGDKLKSEKDESYHFASIQHKQIKQMYKNSSLHGQADWHHYREMVTKRKILLRSHPQRWISYLFGDLLCKYGTSFVRVLAWSLVVILLSAFLHSFNNSLLFHNRPIDGTFWDALYFSIVTFTTLGYGDFHAVENMRFVAAGEGFAGSALMALFTVIVARNVIRD